MLARHVVPCRFLDSQYTCCFISFPNFLYTIAADNTSFHLVDPTALVASLICAAWSIPPLFTKVPTWIHCYGSNGTSKTPTIWPPSRWTVARPLYWIFVCPPCPWQNWEDTWAASTPLPGRHIRRVTFARPVTTVKLSFGILVPCPSVPWKTPFWPTMPRVKSTISNGQPPSPTGSLFATMTSCKYCGFSSQRHILFMVK